ncbi:MAG: DedA family protein [Spirochaetes bacterium]|nr:DedA family protein [Spirochaetota bacterium]
MEDAIQQFLQYLLPKNDLFLYIFLFISAVIENLFPPVPGDTITAFGAFLVGTGRLSYLLVYISTTIGSVTGFMLLFLFGKFLGRNFFELKNYKYFSFDKIRKTESWIQKYGYRIILFNRFMPGIRSVISITTGISKLKVNRVILLSLISALVWNFIWIQAGFMLGNNWETVKQKLKLLMMNYNIFAGIAILAGIIIFLIIKHRKSANFSNKS